LPNLPVFPRKPPDLMNRYQNSCFASSFLPLPNTLLTGLRLHETADAQVGDEIGADQYKNHLVAILADNGEAQQISQADQDGQSANHSLRDSDQAHCLACHLASRAAASGVDAPSSQREQADE